MPVYYYQGIERLSWFFRSPNVCATFLAVCIVVCIGLHLQCRRSPRRWTIVLTWFLAALAGIGELCLALTYSRGGLVALLAAMAALWGMLRCRTVLVFLLLAVGMALLVSHGVSRVQSIADYGGDASLRNRIFLWRGAAGMIAESPWRGKNYAGYYYHAWRQPLWFQDEYRTMISDPLTLGTYYGIWAAMLYLLLIAMLVWNGGKYARAGLSCAEATGGLTAGVVAYAVAACFSTMYEHVPLMRLLTVPLLALIVILVRAAAKRQFSLRRRDFLFPLAFSVFLCMGIYVVGKLENACLSIRWEVAERKYVGNPCWLIHAWPLRPIRGRILFFTDAHGSTMASQIQPAIRQYLRPLALAGYDVYSIGTDSGYNGKAAALAGLREMLEDIDDSLPFAIIGCGTGAKNALLAAGDDMAKTVDLVAAVDAPAVWPFEGLSPDEVIDRYHGRLMLLATSIRQDDMYTLADLRSQHGLETICVELPAQTDVASEPPVAQILSALISP